MKVLITGAAGSVGHQALLAFSAAGHDVVCTDIVEDKNVSFKFIKGNLTDPFFVANLLKDEKPDIVVNCAAIVDIGKSYKDLRRVNFDAVATLFDRCCFMGVARLIHISTGSLYKPGNVPHVENEEIKFGNDYEKSKFDAEKYLLKAYNENILKDRFVSKVSILRPTLIYGPRSRVLFSSMACIPEILKSFRIKKVPQLIGGPKTNLVHCEDVARICLHLAEDDFGSRGFEIYNASDLDPMPFFEFMNPINEIGGLELTDTKVGPYKFFKIMPQQFKIILYLEHLIS